jgi:hypothetical protein
MRKLALAVLIMAAVGLLAGPAMAQDPPPDCEDFNSQAEAQAHLRANPSDPGGIDGAVGPASVRGPAPDPRPHPGDGIACETLPGPFDREPVFDGGQPPPTTGPGTTEQKLPFTGPRESLLPLGLALMVVGAGAVAFTRYRGRHAAR